MAEPARQLPEEDRPVTRPDLRALEGGGATSGSRRGHLQAVPGEGGDQEGGLYNPDGRAGDKEAVSPGDLANAESKSGVAALPGEKLGAGSSQERGRDSGFFTASPGSATSPKNFFGGTKGRRRRTIFGGLGIGGGIGGIFVFIIISGPGQLVQLSHILQRNFDNSQTVSSSRDDQLFRYSTAADIGETRLGILGRSVLRPQVQQLNDLGITFKLNSAAGLNSATIDTEKLASKYPELSGMSENEKTAWLNEHFPDSNGQFQSSDGGKTFTVDTSDFALSADQALFNGLVGELDNGLVVSALNTRILSDYLNVSSLFHPLSKLAESKLKQATTAAQRKQQAEEDEQTADAGVENDPAAVGAENRVQGDDDNFGDPIEKGLLVTSTACFMRSIAGDINTINRYRVELPSAVEAVRFVSIGEQVESGQDVTADQVGGVEESLTNSQGQNIWQGKALQATEGDTSPGGTDIPESYRQAFTGSGTASTIKSWADSFFGGSDTVASVSCSTPGQIVQLVLIVGLQATDVFDGGLSSAGLFALNQSESFVASAAVMGLLHQVILNKTTDGKLAKDAFSGGLGGNLLAYGARAAANIAGAAQGLIPLSGTDSTTLSDEQQLQSQQQFDSESIFARIFNINDYRSLAGHLADSLSPNMMGDLASAVGGFSHIGGDLLSNLSSIFQPKVQAASSYNWGFGTVGIPPSMLNDPSLANPYSNADTVAGVLDSQCLNSDGSVNTGCNYIQKANTCFGDNIEKDPADPGDPASDTWDVVPDHPVDTNDPTYIAANCGDVSDPTWKRIIMFVVDTKNMQAMACYVGDDASCTEIGVTGSSGGTTTATVTTTTAGVTLDTADLDQDSTGVACATNTRDIGVYQGYTNGNEVNIRLCAIPNLPSTGEESNDGYGVTGGDGQCVLNSRVSGAVYAMVQAADKAGVSLAATSCFRTMAHQQALFAEDGGDTDLAAVPGTSNHQMGLAIDFQTLTQSPGPDTGNPVWDWLNANAANFGYHNSPVVEAWHWSPSGN